MSRRMGSRYNNNDDDSSEQGSGANSESFHSESEENNEEYDNEDEYDNVDENEESNNNEKQSYEVSKPRSLKYSSDTYNTTYDHQVQKLNSNNDDFESSRNIVDIYLKKNPPLNEIQKKSPFRYSIVSLDTTNQSSLINFFGEPDDDLPPYLKKKTSGNSNKIVGVEFVQNLNTELSKIQTDSNFTSDIEGSVTVHMMPGSHVNLQQKVEGYVIDNVSNLPIVKDMMDLPSIGDLYISLPIYDEHDKFIVMFKHINAILKQHIAKISSKIKQNYVSLDGYENNMRTVKGYDLQTLIDNVNTDSSFIVSLSKFHKAIENDVLHELSMCPGMGELVNLEGDNSTISLVNVSESNGKPVSVSSLSEKGYKTDDNDTMFIDNKDHPLLDYDTLSDIDEQTKKQLKSNSFKKQSIDKTSSWIYYKSKLIMNSYNDISRCSTVGFDVYDIYSKLEHDLISSVVTFQKFFDDHNVKILQETKRMVTILIGHRIKFEILKHVIKSMSRFYINIVSGTKKEIKPELENQTEPDVCSQTISALNLIENGLIKFIDDIIVNEYSIQGLKKANAQEYESFHEYCNQYLTKNKSEPYSERYQFNFHMQGKPKKSNVSFAELVRMDKFNLDIFGEFSKIPSNDFKMWKKKILKDNEEITKIVHGFQIIEYSNNFISSDKNTLFNSYKISRFKKSDHDDQSSREIGIYWYSCQQIRSNFGFAFIKSGYANNQWIVTQCVSKDYTLENAFFPLELPKKCTKKVSQPEHENDSDNVLTMPIVNHKQEVKKYYMQIDGGLFKKYKDTIFFKNIIGNFMQNDELLHENKDDRPELLYVYSKSHIEKDDITHIDDINKLKPESIFIAPRSMLMSESFLEIQPLILALDVFNFTEKANYERKTNPSFTDNYVGLTDQIFIPYLKTKQKYIFLVASIKLTSAL